MGGFEEDKDLKEVASRVAEEAVEEESSTGKDIKEFVAPIG